jgi:hypothetical protein
MGYIKINRKIFDHWVFDDAWAFKAWVDLIGMANYEPSQFLINGKAFRVERGEMIRSLQTLARRWDCSVSKVSNLLKMLQDDGMVEFSSEKLATRIKITQYEDYQGIEPSEQTQKKREKNAEKTQKKPYKERKNIFKNTLVALVTENNKDMCQAFYEYWTESSPDGLKMRFEMEKVFDMNRRLRTWARNESKFSTKPKPQGESSNDLYANVMKQIHGTKAGG